MKPICGCCGHERKPEDKSNWAKLILANGQTCIICEECVAVLLYDHVTKRARKAT